MQTVVLHLQWINQSILRITGGRFLIVEVILQIWNYKCANSIYKYVNSDLQIWKSKTNRENPVVLDWNGSHWWEYTYIHACLYVHTHTHIYAI